MVSVKPECQAHWSVGSCLTLVITAISWEGQGVGEVNGVMIQVPFVMIDEVVEVEVVAVNQHAAQARLIKVLQPSPQRVLPPCPYFGECGGCQYQHLDYEVQLQLKQNQVAEILERVGGFSAPAVAPTLPCPQPYGYRNRIMVRSYWDKVQQKMNLGFLRYDSRRVVDVEACQIAEPPLNQQLQQVRLNPPRKGGIKFLLRVDPEGWEVPNHSFFQNNLFLLPKLVEVVRDCLQACGMRYLIDVYCGVGLFAIELADLVEAFVGVEIDQTAIAAARRNAAKRQRYNGEFVAGDALELLPHLLAKFSPHLTTVILDPPRKGCSSDSIRRLRQERPAQILYVSCHPETLARDLKVLCAEETYKLVSVVPLDMFPQTRHVECVADLRVQA